MVPVGFEQQWEAGPRTLATRVPDVSGAPSLVERMVLFTSFISSLCAFEAQFADVLVTSRKDDEHEVECMTKYPRQSFHSSLVYNLKALNGWEEVRDDSQIALEAQIRIVRGGRVRQ